MACQPPLHRCLTVRHEPVELEAASLWQTLGSQQSPVWRQPCLVAAMHCTAAAGEPATGGWCGQEAGVVSDSSPGSWEAARRWQPFSCNRPPHNYPLASAHGCSEPAPFAWERVAAIPRGCAAHPGQSDALHTPRWVRRWRGCQYSMLTWQQASAAMGACLAGFANAGGPRRAV